MVTSLAYYLKYRPQSLAELIGQESVKKTLLSSFKSNKLSHAYLFVGPRGTGKTSTARILAKMVNCEANNEVDNDVPCNKCSTCLSITDGSNLDLIEIDAASNRGIEDIRSLRDKIKLSPTKAKKKVYIVDEVHMLTTEAFNALLKTLEEPPQHALFILATTEGAKIPATILSRVQKLDFELATTEELLEALEKIAKAEKIDITQEALKILVKKSDGSFRDGVKLLDQLASVGEKITAEILNDSLKSTSFENILNLVIILASKDAKEGLLNIGKQLKEGADTKDIILSLMDALRSLILIKNNVGEVLVKPQLTEDKYQSLVEVSQSFHLSDLIKSLDILQNSLEKLKFSSIVSLPLELAIVEICQDNLIVSSPTNNPENHNQNPVTSSQNIKQSIKEEKEQKQDVKLTAEESAIEELTSEKSVKLEIIKTELVIEKADDQSKASSSNEDILKLKEKWNLILETVRPVNFSLEALLRSINVLECTANTVIIEAPYSFHQRILEAPKNRDLLEGVFSDVLGRSVRISTVLGSRPQRKADIANIEVAQDDEIIRAAAEIFNSDTVN